MVKAKIIYPDFAKGRGKGYWLKASNLWAARKKFRTDNSNVWRYSFGLPEPVDRSVRFSELLDPGKKIDRGFRFIIIGDTGEGDCSQYGTIPLIRRLEPDFMIINGDIAYPAGRIKENDRNKDDYLAGFFEPYRNLNIPIWSVPGNHEYYARGQGREYYEIFCTRKFANRWTKYGLRLVPQPGTFWELNERDKSFPLVVIGIDAGKTGNLDGHKGRRKIPNPDDRQLSWFENRLMKADKEGKNVIVLFHIPALSREKNVKKVHLKKLHQIICSHSCVRMVVCGHDHNYQSYAPEVFHKYLDKEMKCRPKPGHEIHYIVSGGGGAYLTSTNFKRGFWDRIRNRKQYQTENTFPTRDQWSNYARFGRKAIDKLGMSKTFVGRLANLIEKDALSDVDPVRYLSMQIVDVRKDSQTRKLETVVTPVFMDNLVDLFPEDTIIDVQARDLPIIKEKFDECIQSRQPVKM